MALVSLDYKISWDDFESICDTAGYSIGYWAKSGHINKEDRVYMIIDDESVQHIITQAKVEQVIADLYNRKKPCPEATWKSVELAILQDEYGEIDAGDADIIFQYACFGEIVYG